MYALRLAREVWREFSYNFHMNGTRELQPLVFIGAPDRIRTGVLALRGLCPGPLDDGSEECGAAAERGIIGNSVDCSSRKLLIERVFCVRSDAYLNPANHHAI